MRLKKYKFRIISIVVLSMCFQCSFAQEAESYENLMSKMREYTWEKQEYDKAIEIGKELLERYPNNASVEQFMGNLYFYTGQDSIATIYLESSLLKQPDNTDIINSLYHLKFKQGDYIAAERYVDKLMMQDATNLEYQLRKVQIYSAINKRDEAVSLLNELKKEYPDDQTIKYLSGQLELRGHGPVRIYNNGIGILYRQLNYSQGIDPKILISGRYIRKARKATFVNTGTYGKHSDNKGILLETELYYNHNADAYSHALINWSNKKELFAQFNSGYTYFQHIGKGWVPGIGARYTYSNHNHVYTVLADISKYWGRNLSQFRFYGIFDDGQFYQAYNFNHRFFFTSNNYLQFMYTLGTSPDDKTRLAGSNLDFKANNFSLFGNVRLTNKLDTRAYFNYTHQKISSDQHYSIYEFGVELVYNF